jgi:hypothetical protein
MDSMRVDLDQFEALYWRAVDPKIGRHRFGEVISEVLFVLPALVAELRAAREVVEAVRAANLNPLAGGPRGWVTVERAVIAYDQAAGS